MACMEVGRVSTRDSYHSSLNDVDGWEALLDVVASSANTGASIDF